MKRLLLTTILLMLFIANSNASNATQAILKLDTKCEDDKKTGLCIIGGKPSKVVSGVRALNLNAKKAKIEKAEASISWTSFKN